MKTVDLGTVLADLHEGSEKFRITTCQVIKTRSALQTGFLGTDSLLIITNKSQVFTLGLAFLEKPTQLSFKDAWKSKYSFTFAL